MTATTTFQLWFEPASTYSYPAVCRVEPLAAAAGATVIYRPFLLGPIFKRQGWNDSPFNVYPEKGRYMWRDIERLCAKYQLPFKRPGNFPRSSLLTARVACLAAGEPWEAAFLCAVYQANFAEDRDIGDPSVVAEILDSLGQPGRALVERAAEPATKELLRRATDEAAALGIFGAPTFMVGNEMFWGNDRLEDALAWYVAGTGG